jgi:hypothetical protein
LKGRLSLDYGQFDTAIKSYDIINDYWSVFKILMISKNEKGLFELSKRFNLDDLYFNLSLSCIDILGDEKFQELIYTNTTENNEEIKKNNYLEKVDIPINIKHENWPMIVEIKPAYTLEREAIGTMYNANSEKIDLISTKDFSIWMGFDKSTNLTEIEENFDLEDFGKNNEDDDFENNINNQNEVEENDINIENQNKDESSQSQNQKHDDEKIESEQERLRNEYLHDEEEDDEDDEE